MYKTKTPGAVFSFPILMGLLALPILFVENTDSPNFYSWQQELVTLVSSSHIIHYFSAVLLLYISAIQLNRVVNVYGFYSKNTYLPGLIYAITLASFDQIHFSAALLAYAFLIFGIGYLFRITRQDSASESVFMAALLFGIATVFSPFLLPIIVLPWFSLVVFRYFVWREWFMLLIGFSIPWGYHYGVYFAVTGEWNILAEGFALVNSEIEFSIEKASLMTFMALLVIYSIWKFLVILNTQLLVFKKRSRLLFHFIWLTIITLVFAWYFQDVWIIAAAIPLTIIISVQILNATQSLYSNLMLTAWIALIVWNLIL
ncbi:MAG: hypothetical protein GQ574_01835 [Crocinitomix sp.]|nr:hypothetical protein [Crocinitomix sp.]